MTRRGAEEPYEEDDELLFGEKKQRLKKYGIKKDQTEIFVKVKQEETTGRMELAKFRVTTNKFKEGDKPYKRSNSASLLLA